MLEGQLLLSGDAVSWAGEAAGRGPYEPADDVAQAQISLVTALRRAEVVYPCHDRAFHAGPPVTYIDDYALRLRLFTDPEGQDEEIRVGSYASKSFASWPTD